jgi:hypothetical protein
MDIIKRLRDNLQPRGTAPVVKLRIAGHGMFNSDFVSKCIDDLENITLRAHVGDPPSNLEKLAYQLLLDSAYIDLKHENEREKWLRENT